MTPLNYNPVRRSRRTRHYRVCVTDGAIYAKIFEARSPRHALVQASIDTERNRDWRNDWFVIGLPVGGEPTVNVVEVQP
jgi:hypothetical protein